MRKVGETLLTDKLNKTTERYEKAHRRRTLWYRIISFLSAITVFVTTYALILPALTMEPSAGIKMDNVFLYEDDDVCINFYVTGRAAFADADEEVQDAKKEFVDLTVTRLSEDDAVYNEYAKYADKNIEEEKLYKLLAVNLQFTYRGAELNVDGCEISCEIVAKEDMVGAGWEQMHAKQDSIPRMLSAATGTAASEDSDTSEQTEEVLALTVLQDVTGNLTDRDTAFLADDSEEMTMTLDTALSGTTMGVALYSTVNPVYDVQYYVYTPVMLTDEDVEAMSDAEKAQYKSVEEIDTTGGILPNNTEDLVPVNIWLRIVDASKYQYEVATKLDIRKIYNDQTFEYVKAPAPIYADKLRDSASYVLREIWVLKEGYSADTVESDAWTRYEVSKKGEGTTHTITFTNNINAAGGDCIYIGEDTVLRYIYGVDEVTNTIDADFYDYDITDGMIYTGSSFTGATATSKQTNTSTWYANSKEQGINNFTAASGTVKYAFGNSNANTGLGAVVWAEGGNATLNQYNRSASLRGCTFGIVTAMKDNGQLQFATGISAPEYLFNQKTVGGQTYFNNFDLQFSRVGDTYVLTSVLQDGKTAPVLTNLDILQNPVSGSGSVHSTTFSNNFWPMDYASSWGANGHDLKFGDYTYRKLRKYGTGTYSYFPEGDDGKDHNSYFGMHYEVTFTLDEDYIGPLEYIFYGDDDMWVFLDGKLVCDIGGVHSAVGEYVDLWDYIKKMEDADKYGEHTLSFYYTERGASGSTCYMQFTLPSVLMDQEQTTSSDLVVSKTVANSDTTERFEFTVELLDANNNLLIDNYSYTIYDVDGNAREFGVLSNVVDAATGEAPNKVYLAQKEKLEIKYLPPGCRYRITETEYPGFHVSYQNSSGAVLEGNQVTGTLVTGDNTINFINSTSMLLPKTGGTGVWFYMIPMGVAVIYTVIVLPILIKRKRE